MIKNIQKLGACEIPSPLRTQKDKVEKDLIFVNDTTFIPANIEYDKQEVVFSTEQTFFEKAGPRDKIFFNPNETIAGIVTCGGISCPGLIM